MKVVPSAASLRYLRHALSLPHSAPLAVRACHPLARTARKLFHSSRRLYGIKTHTLSDIGEGVKEVQIIQWFVEEGAKIEEWGALCEVQSDKASTEITSKHTGVIKKIYHKRDEVVQVGDPMVDIEVEGEEDEPVEEEEGEGEEEGKEEENGQQEEETETKKKVPPQPEPQPEPEVKEEKGKNANLATPAIRSLLKEHSLKIEDIEGTGKDGRVLKEDVFKHLEGGAKPAVVAVQQPKIDSKQTETVQRLTPIQAAMFKSMTASLNIPHFLYTDSVNITDLGLMRKRVNATRNPETTPKLSYLPFMIKAVSLALIKYPLLNARLDVTDPKKPQMQLRSNHNIGVAMDTPNGLLVPVIKSVNARSVASISQELLRLSERGQAGKLSNEDLSGGTITVSNIGNIGGEVLAPVIVEGQLAILAVGKVKATPVFDDDGQVQRADMVNMSWSADHRVIDGATMAKMASVVKGYLEEPGSMIVEMT